MDVDAAWMDIICKFVLSSSIKGHGQYTTNDGGPKSDASMNFIPFFFRIFFNEYNICARFFLIEDEVYLHTYVISCIKIGIDFNPGLFWFYERRWKVKNKQDYI